MTKGRCIFFHRTAVVMADGEVTSCANMYAEHIGHLDEVERFGDVWNNERMTDLRASFGTEREWAQCRSCWFREIRYAEQRAAWSERRDCELRDATEFTEEAWDFRGFEPSGR